MFSVVPLLPVGLLLVLSAQFIDVPLVNARDYYRQGMALMRARKYDDAVTFFRRALEKQPDYAEAYCGRGMAHNALKVFGMATADFSKAIALKPQYAEAYAGRGGACLNLRGSQPAACLSDLEQAIKLNPKLAEAFVLRGLYYRQTGDLKRARAEFDRAILVQPRNVDALSARASLLIKMGDRTAAAVDLNRLVDVGDPASAASARQALRQLAEKK